METTKDTIEILQDLIRINNDRITGYERAMKELKDADEDLKILFAGMIDESREAKLALSEEVQVMGEDVDDGTPASGKIYRAWMDVKAIFSGENRKSILENCHTGEHAALKAYTAALEHEQLPLFLREMIEKQKSIFEASHDEVKSLRDEEVESI